MNEGIDLPFCRYHGDTTARWRCGPCALDLCTSCKPLAEQLSFDVSCPLCGDVMNDLAIGTPFWREPHRQLAYPLKHLMLILVGTLAVAGMIVPSGVSLWLFCLVAYSLLSWQAFHVFRLSVAGQAEPPDIGQLGSFGHWSDFVQFMKVMTVHAGLILLALWLMPPLLSVLIVIMVAGLLPATLIRALLAGDIRSAFEPEGLYQQIRRMGLVWPILAGLALVLLVGPFLLLFPLTGLLPDWLYRGLLIPLYGYAWVLIARYCGIALFQYRRQWRIAGSATADVDSQEPAPEDYEPALAVADSIVQAREGLSTDARWTVGQALARYPHHPEINEQFERLLISSGNDSELRNHLDRRLHKLALDRNDTKAIEAWSRSREMLGDWMPSSSEARHRIGLALTKAGQHRDALKLLLSVRTNNPNYDLMPEACLRAAQIMEAFMGDADGADKLRAAVRRRHPGRAEYWERHGDPR